MRPSSGSTAGSRIPAPTPSAPGAVDPSRWPIRPASTSSSSSPMPGRSGIGSLSGLRRDRDEPVRAVGVQAVSHRHAAQSGLARGVVGDDAEELLQRTPSGLHRAGEDVALGGPVAVGDRERGELVPQEEEAAERREETRVQPARVHRGDAVLPDQAPGDCVAVLQDDQRAVGPRRDRSRSALDRHDRLEVQRTLGLERLRLGQKVGERVDLEETTSRPRSFRGLEPAQLRLDRRGGRGLRSQLPVHRDRADEDARADIVERLAELGRHGRRQLLGAWQHAADRRPELVASSPWPPRRGASASVAALRGYCNGFGLFGRARLSSLARCLVARLLQSRPAPFCSIEVMSLAATKTWILVEEPSRKSRASSNRRNNPTPARAGRRAVFVPRSGAD